MRLKLLTLRKGFVNYIQSRSYPHSGKPQRCDAHMNELPIPCIPWEPWYKDKQAYYTKILVAGALWFLFSVGMMIWTDSIFMNCKPPSQPGPPSDMIEECDDTE